MPADEDSYVQVPDGVVRTTVVCVSLVVCTCILAATIVHSSKGGDENGLVVQIIAFGSMVTLQLLSMLNQSKTSARLQNLRKQLKDSDPNPPL